MTRSRVPASNAHISPGEEDERVCGGCGHVPLIFVMFALVFKGVVKHNIHGVVVVGVMVT